MRMRMTRLFGGETHRFALTGDHLAHVADAAGALGLAAGVTENLGGARGALLDGRAHVAFPDPVAITDVQKRASQADCE